MSFFGAKAAHAKHPTALISFVYYHVVLKRLVGGSRVVLRKQNITLFPPSVAKELVAQGNPGQSIVSKPLLYFTCKLYSTAAQVNE